MAVHVVFYAYFITDMRIFYRYISHPCPLARPLVRAVRSGGRVSGQGRGSKSEGNYQLCGEEHYQPSYSYS